MPRIAWYVNRKYKLNGKIEARTPLIKSGSNVWEGIGQKYVVMFTHEKINEILGVSFSLASDITIYAANGDDAALALSDISVVYISGQDYWCAFFTDTVPNGKNFRLNYAIFYSPGSSGD